MNFCEENNKGYQAFIEEFQEKTSEENLNVKSEVSKKIKKIETFFESCKKKKKVLSLDSESFLIYSKYEGVNYYFSFVLDKDGNDSLIVSILATKENPRLAKQSLVKATIKHSFTWKDFNVYVVEDIKKEG